MATSSSSENGYSIGLTLSALLLQVASHYSPEQWLTALSIVMVLLAIVYHVLGIRERVINIAKGGNRIKKDDVAGINESIRRKAKFENREE